jgi:peptidoglycan/LPS O-acetylase OafA/YrhL
LNGHKLGYRAEIDGLRAIASVPVIIFHFSPESLSGGFAGVDVFFIISGFLITSLILKEHQSGTFSLRFFWLRRIKHIISCLINFHFK